MKYFLLLSLIITNACFAQQIETSVSQLKFVGEYDLPNALQYKGTTVGGLSGIDYDVKQNVYYLISDDKSEKNPARFYTAKIHFTDKTFDSVQLTAVKSLLDKEGRVYPNAKQDAFHTPDPEAIRYNPLKDDLTWTSEGERKVKTGDTVLENPAITIINKQGLYKDIFTLPANMLMNSDDKGPRDNGVFEGLSFADNFKNVFVSVEEPIYEDGKRADNTDSAWIRVLKFDNTTHQPIAQYAYQIDPVPYPATPADAFKINGVSDILYIGNDKLLVLERAYSTGRFTCNVRLYSADLKNASNVSNIISLDKQKPFIPLQKQLLLNFDSLHRFIDNIEGVTVGPKLSNGHHTLLFVSDDNFSKLERTQFLLFEIIP
ncbi:esterase-like activity of phytase family protein [Ferruginibacter albus]|uniref:esterase-like activity of phytase family protein n=1 Tax=Ferruginibacter albus TaxID=2875540 RepID=UPI001CC75A96|nr:esterase-like activity of phytase family protein [Ferruginibacter albus]UAY51174.1 esterase-like activity of phytase family protein [Ferruginibacter albus]